MRPLIIDDEMKARIQRLIDAAQANRIDLPTLKKIAAGELPPPGDIPAHICFLPFGWKIVFTIEQQPNGWFLHMSVSVDSKDKVPNPIAVQEIATILGFPSLDQCMVYPEKFPGGTAINVMCPVGG